MLVGVLRLASVQTRGHVILDAPNGGEVLEAGSVFTIEWQVQIAHNQLNWDLWYSTTGPPIPTVSEWGMVVMALLMLAAGTTVFRRPMGKPAQVGSAGTRTG